MMLSKCSRDNQLTKRSTRSRAPRRDITRNNAERILTLKALWALLLGILANTLYANSAAFNFYFVGIILAAMIVFPTTTLQMQLVDLSVLAIAAYEVPSLLLSQYYANSVRTSWIIATGVLYYYAIRITIRTPVQIASLSTVFGIGGALFGIYGFRQFVVNSGHLEEVGFSPLVAFRSQLISPPGPWISGEWFTLVLLTLPFACVFLMYLWKRERTWIAVIALSLPIIITGCLLLSLSRAILWSIVIFYLLLCGLLVLHKTLDIRTGGILLASCFGVLLLAIVAESLVYPGTSRAYSGKHVSQVRSTQGRVAIWKRSIDLVREHPLWGVGSGNAALYLLSTADEEETTGFASRTFSLPIQVLAEKGIIGFFVYVAVVVLVGIEFIRAMRLPTSSGFSMGRKEAGKSRDKSDKIVAHGEVRAMRCCFAAGLAAALIRELTYSSILEHSLTFVLVMIQAALICAPEKGTA